MTHSGAGALSSNVTGIGTTPGRRDVYRRALDITVSAGLLLLTLPVIVIAAVGSALSLRATPFFVQRRVGRDGEEFLFIKVRTLPVETPAYIDKHQIDARRIPAFCRLLRRFHLDELPQLLLVLLGRMSLVGPRPEMSCLHEELPDDFAELRTSVRPGCTGLWQISDGCTDLIGRRPEYDTYYLEQRNLRLDLWVLGRTALKMSGLKGTVTLEDVPRWVGSEPRELDVTLDLTQIEASVGSEAVSA
jgi:lipopolysaccharide/colanic/teichoic acid biosynthesis glycosyltransferase